MEKNILSIETVASIATEKFFEAMAELFPEAKSGDLDIGLTMEFETDEAAGIVELMVNKPVLYQTTVFDLPMIPGSVPMPDGIAGRVEEAVKAAVCAFYYHVETALPGALRSNLSDEVVRHFLAYAKAVVSHWVLSNVPQAAPEFA